MITQEEKVDQVRRVTLDCQWGTGERLRLDYVDQFWMQFNKLNFRQYIFCLNYTTKPKLSF